MASAPISRRIFAELLGTFWLVFGGCGSAIFSATYPDLGIGFLGVALAFGLTVLTMAYALGPISGAHLNPAVSLGLVVARRFPIKDLLPYVLAQICGAMLGAAILYLIASDKAGFDMSSGFAANGYGLHSPAGYSLGAALIAETVLTFMFLMIVLGATEKRAPAGFAPLAIGLGLTLIHLIGIPITNTSVNPARSTSQAFFVGGWAIQQLWVFWLAPLAGAFMAGLVYPLMAETQAKPSLTRETNNQPPTRITRIS